MKTKLPYAMIFFESQVLSMIIEIIKAIINGIVEGITEWLPISSTGHLILVQEFIPFKLMTANFIEMFNVVIQLGAIMAVVVTFWYKIWPLRTNAKTKKLFLDAKITNLWIKILIASVPAAVIGLLFDDKIDELFFNPWVVSAMLILYGIFFIVIENYYKHKTFKITDIEGIDYKTALLIGIFQLLALIPGTSRSGATIIGAMLIGVNRVSSAQFTFYLAIPVMLGASLLKLVKFVVKSGLLSFTELSILLLGSIVAFIVSLKAISFLMDYVKRNDFKVFGIYRIVLGVVVLLIFGVKLLLA